MDDKRKFLIENNLSNMNGEKIAAGDQQANNKIKRQYLWNNNEKEKLIQQKNWIKQFYHRFSNLFHSSPDFHYPVSI